MPTKSIRLEHPLAQGAEVADGETWTFAGGLIGLPDHRAFALLALEGAPPFRLLASLDDPAFGLVLVDPTALVPGYELTLEASDLAALDIPATEPLEILVPVVLPQGGTPLSLNLKGPLVFAAGVRRGGQVVSRDENHPVRFEPDLGGTAGSCSS
ncbi:flagellar assembly protein FliW [bacterium]|nr:flagellar assembly protein FliW [bacterium]